MEPAAEKEGNAVATVEPQPSTNKQESESVRSYMRTVDNIPEMVLGGLCESLWHNYMDFFSDAVRRVLRLSCSFFHLPIKE